MKTKTILLYLALAIVAGVCNACKKEHDKTDQAPTGLKDNEVADKIRNFKNQGSSGFKSGEEVDIEEALWYITTTANYTYSDLTAENEKTWVDTCLINISLTNSKVSLTEVYAKYELMVENLRSFYAAKSEENKQFLTVSLETVSMDDNNLLCKASAVFTYAPITGGGFCNFDNSTSYSYSYDWLNNATCYIPSTVETDGAEEIQKRIMRCKGMHPSNYYYEPTISKYISNPLYHLPPMSSGTPHNYGFSYVYWNSSQYPDFEGCLSPYYLNFYLERIKEYIYTEVTNYGFRPVGDALIDIDLWGIEGNDPNGYLLYFHQARVNYGILRLRPDPRDILD